MRLFEEVAATGEERNAPMAGDDLVARADAVLDRAFTLPAPPDVVWPWLVQLGKRRAGWYLPCSVERFIPQARRARRSIDPQWQQLGVGDVVPDYGGRNEYFEAVLVDRPRRLVYRSQRGRMYVTWSISLAPSHAGTSDGTRLHLHFDWGLCGDDGW